MPRLRALPLALLLAACSGPPSSAPSAAPAQPASVPLEDKPTPARAEPERETPGFADPRSVDDAPAPANEPADPALATRIRERFGERCKLERSCGELLGVDCQSAVDGPYYYVQRADLKTVATCGGACMGGRCTDCPPKAWTCAVY